MVEFLQANSTWIIFGVFILAMLWMHGGIGHSHRGHGSHRYTGRPDDEGRAAPGQAGYSDTELAHNGHGVATPRAQVETERREEDAREPAAAGQHGRHRHGC